MLLDFVRVLLYVSRRHVLKRHTGTARTLRAVPTRKPARENPNMHVICFYVLILSVFEKQLVFGV